jgi:hypothetical protein
MNECVVIANGRDAFSEAAAGMQGANAQQNGRLREASPIHE